VAQVNARGTELWVFSSANEAVAIPKQTNIPSFDASSTSPIIFNQDELFGKGGCPAIPVYLMTDSGLAIASIFPQHTRETFLNYVAKLRAELPGIEVIEYAKSSSDGQFAPISGMNGGNDAEVTS
jgi:hypothetical protein